MLNPLFYKKKYIENYYQGFKARFYGAKEYENPSSQTANRFKYSAWWAGWHDLDKKLNG